MRLLPAPARSRYTAVTLLPQPTLFQRAALAMSEWRGPSARTAGLAITAAAVASLATFAVRGSWQICTHQNGSAGLRACKLLLDCILSGQRSGAVLKVLSFCWYSGGSCLEEEALAPTEQHTPPGCLHGAWRGTAGSDAPPRNAYGCFSESPEPDDCSTPSFLDRCVAAATRAADQTDSLSHRSSHCRCLTGAQIYGDVCPSRQPVGGSSSVPTACNIASCCYRRYCSSAATPQQCHLQCPALSRWFARST